MCVSEVTRSWQESDVRVDEIREVADKDLVIREAMKFTVDG